MLVFGIEKISPPKSRRRAVATSLILSLLMLGWPAGPARAVTRDIIFPVIGPVTFYNDFGQPRTGHTHEGNDLMGKKMQSLVAAVDGTVRFVAWPQPEFGYLVSIEDEEGYSYRYLHINNDHLGTDDGLGGGHFAYAPGMKSGNPVVKGQLIGWMGDSGNAESTSPHLHFEIRDPDGEPFSPYPSLIQATRISKPIVPPAIPDELLPYGEFRGGAHLAFGQTYPATTEEELITGAGPGGGPDVRVFQQDDVILQQFYAYPKDFRGGVDVAAGDVDGDGTDEIITVPGPGGGPQVKIFSASGQQQIEFYAYSELFKNGISVAAADLDGDGQAEIITGAGPKMEPRVKVFNAAGQVLAEWLAYVPLFQGGIDVAAIAATENNSSMIITAPGPGGGPDVRAFTMNGDPLLSFFAYDTSFRGGVRVDVADARKHGSEVTASTPPEIITVPSSRGGAQVRAFNLSGQPDYQKFFFESWWRGGYDVAAADGVIRVASGKTNIGPGGRRASIMNITTSSFFFGFNDNP